MTMVSLPAHAFEEPRSLLTEAFAGELAGKAFGLFARRIGAQPG
jgi:hypothetical protein